MNIQELYSSTMQKVKELQDNIETKVTEVMIKAELHLHPKTIGNLDYSVIKEGDKYVPAYRYTRNKNGDFVPIYDREHTGEFGWYDFNECCKLFDLILRNITKDKE